MLAPSPVRAGWPSVGTEYTNFDAEELKLDPVSDGPEDTEEEEDVSENK